MFDYIGGDGRDRTADLLIANQSLSQLSYAPIEAEILRGHPAGVNERVRMIGVMKIKRPA